MGVLHTNRRFFRSRSIKQKVLLYCLVALGVYVVLSQALAQVTRLYKFVPTDFSYSSRYQNWLDNSRDDNSASLIVEVTGQDEVNFDNRYQFVKHLGSGFEGSADVYIDTVADDPVVIKTYRSYTANPLPPSLLRQCCGHVDSWPAEIPATQFLGGGLNPLLPRNETFHSPIEGLSNMLYLTDYFVAFDRTSNSWLWRLVTPFAKDGTLVQYSKTLSKLNLSAPELDVILRPAFTRFLRDLHTVHVQGYCHNDIKPSNILFLDEHQTKFNIDFASDHDSDVNFRGNATISNETERTLTRPWTLADFGQVREIDHPYHRTLAFRQANQLNDCVANDAKRALKTYLWLLRQAGNSKSDFDEEFYMKRESWSKVYWDLSFGPGGVKRLLSLLQKDHTTTTTTTTSSEDKHDQISVSSMRRAPILRDVFGDDLKALPIAVEQELRCTSLKISWTDWWTLGGIWPKLIVNSNPFVS